MKKSVFWGAAAALAVIAPGVASADTNATVGLHYTSSEIDSFEWDRYGFETGVSHDLSNGSFLQFDGAYDRVDISGCCYANGFGAAHWGMRNDSHSLGGFVVLQNWFGYSGIGFGGEGTFEFQNAWLGGSLGYVDFGDLDVSVTSAQIDGGWNVTPNVELTALVSRSEFENSSSFDWTTFGVGGEFRPDNSPMSFYIGYRHSDFDSDDGSTWRVGVNFDLSTGSLQERRTSGAGLNGAHALHLNLSDFPF